MNLGHLASYHERVKTTPLDAEGARGALLYIIKRMAEVDADIIKSHYGAAVESEDRPPDGYDYDLLWDHILDAINTYVRQPNYRPERDEIHGMSKFTWREAKSTPSTLASARLLVSGWSSLMRLAITQTASRRT